MADVTYSMPHPIVYTEDLGRALRFYRDGLGFEQMYQFPPEGEAVFVGMALDGRELSLGDISAPDAEGAHGLPLRPVSGHRFELCIYASDVDAAMEELRAAGAEVLKEPVDQPWGERMAYVADPDGNPVMICAPLEDAPSG